MKQKIVSSSQELNRSVIQLNHFLSESKLRLETIQHGDSLHAVIGNTGGDLDSVVSAISFAYIRQSQDPTILVIPILNINHDDFRLRTEVEYLFKALGIKKTSLLFSDHVDLEQLNKNQRLSVTLVDHNELAPHQDYLAGSIVGILDHHEDKGLYNPLLRRVPQGVGSTASLVSNYFQNDLIPPAIAYLLLSTIVLDTVNFNPEIDRFRSDDTQARQTLENIIDAYPAKEMLGKLSNAKSDISQLSTAERLRKDPKTFNIAGLNIGISSIPYDAQLWNSENSSFSDEITHYAKKNNQDILLVMLHSGNEHFKRELIILAKNETLSNKLEQELGALLGLHRTSITGNRNNAIKFFSQDKVKISRKKLVPLLESILQQK